MVFVFMILGFDVNKCLLFDVIFVLLIMQLNVKFFVKKGVIYQGIYIIDLLKLKQKLISYLSE